MIKPAEIRPLAQYLAAADIELFECNWPDGALRLRFGGAETGGDTKAVAAQPTGADIAQPVLKSPGIGVLRLCHPLEATRLLAKGDRVEKGDIVAYLETGDVLLPVYSDRSGVVAQWLTEGGDLIGYATPLLKFS